MKKTIALLAAAPGSLALLATFAQAGPTTTSAQAGPTSTSAKMTICHRTKSAQHPYRKITVAGASLAAHQRHGADIVPAPQGGCPSSVMTPTRGGRPLAATMTGAAERPGPGDPDGTGTATIRVTPGLGRVCFVLNVANITLPAAAAHIHIAPPTDPGPIVVTLVAPDASGTSQGCVSTTRALVKAILKNPSAYYVNVHTSDYPAGAVRGQLGKWRGPPSGAAQESNLPSRGLHDRTGLKVCVPRSCWCAVPRTNGLEVPLGRVRSAQVGTNTGTKVADVTTRTAR